eukprot:985738-Amphidinium_carterae.1
MNKSTRKRVSYHFRWDLSRVQTWFLIDRKWWKARARPAQPLVQSLAGLDPLILPSEEITHHLQGNFAT